MFEPIQIDMLILPAACIMLATAIATQAAIPNLGISITTGAIKASIFVLYFRYVFDGSFTLLDDITYLKVGMYLLNEGVGFTNFIDNWSVVHLASGSNAVFYYLYNAYALWLFDTDHYFAPVALNLILAPSIALLGFRLAKDEFGIDGAISSVFFLYLLFHPDIFVWSNFINIKDIFILFLHVILLLAVSQFYKSNYIIAICLFLVSISLLMISRHYVPVLFSIAFLAACKRKYMLPPIFTLAFVVLILFYWSGWSAFVGPIETIWQSFVNPLYGLPRFIMTPIPFNTDPNYVFLNFPAVFHWILSPFLFVGIYRVWRINTRFSKFFLIYLGVFIGLYATVGELQGPRQRVQLDFAIALLQFIGLRAVFERLNYAKQFKR